MKNVLFFATKTLCVYCFYCHFAGLVDSSNSSNYLDLDKDKLIDSNNKSNKFENEMQDYFDKSKIEEIPSRLCSSVLADFIEKKSTDLDFSNTSDFKEEGENAFNEAYKLIVQNKSFGTDSPNLYVNLSKTDVTTDFVIKWHSKFKADKKMLLWNLSYNPNLGDDVIDAFDSFENIYLLNLSHTNITDNGIIKIISILNTLGIGNLKCIILNGTNVSENQINALKSAMKNASQKKSKEYILEADNGVIFEETLIIDSTDDKKVNTNENQILKGTDSLDININKPIATNNDLIDLELNDNNLENVIEEANKLLSNSETQNLISQDTNIKSDIENNNNAVDLDASLIS